MYMIFCGGNSCGTINKKIKNQIKFVSIAICVMMKHIAAAQKKCCPYFIYSDMRKKTN